jgi:hypothetical protein
MAFRQPKLCDTLYKLISVGRPRIRLENYAFFVENALQSS